MSVLPFTPVTSHICLHWRFKTDLILFPSFLIVKILNSWILDNFNCVSSKFTSTYISVSQPVSASTAEEPASRTVCTEARRQLIQPHQYLLSACRKCALQHIYYTQGWRNKLTASNKAHWVGLSVTLEQILTFNGHCETKFLLGAWTTILFQHPHLC